MPRAWTSMTATVMLVRSRAGNFILRSRLSRRGRRLEPVEAGGARLRQILRALPPCQAGHARTAAHPCIPRLRADRRKPLPAADVPEGSDLQASVVAVAEARRGGAAPARR